MNIDNLVFDFNGTLVDDVDICLFLLNKMLKEKGHAGNISKEKYLSIFTFPIIKYYERSGFVFPEDNFDELAKEFDNDYNLAFPSLKLFPDVIDTLTHFKNEGKKLIVLSATKQDNLEDELKMLGIYSFFDAVIGIKDIFGRSKINEAKEYFSSNDIDANKTAFIGDTLHDAEVASSLNGHSILVSRGHQDLNTLKTSKESIILNSLEDIRTIIK